MANSIGRNPWIIDTAGATSVFPAKVAVRMFRWVGGTAGQHCTVTDAAGTRVIWDEIADADDSRFESIFGETEGYFPDGLQVTVLGGGTLYIYVG